MGDWAQGDMAGGDARAVLLVGPAAATLSRRVREAGGEPFDVLDAPAARRLMLDGTRVAAAVAEASMARALAAELPGVRTVAYARERDRERELELAFEAFGLGVADVLPENPGREELEDVLFPQAPRRAGVRDSSLLHGPRLAELSAEVARIARALDGLAQTDAVPPVTGEPATGPVSAGQLRGMIRARRAREQFFKGELFADPAWDILLDLMAARLEGKKVSVSSLCIAAAVPATTALRWIKSMTDGGLLERKPDPVDGRRVFIDLSDRAAETMQAYLATARTVPV